MQLDLLSRVYIVVDAVRTSSPEFFGIFSGWQWLEVIRPKLLRAGIDPEKVQVLLFDPDMNPIMRDADVIIGLGEKVLQFFTDKKGIDKWQLSPLRTSYGQRFISTFSLERVQAQMELGLYVELAFQKARLMAGKEPYLPPEERFRINPPLEEAISLLDYIKTQPEVSVDVETGYGQINTVGFAWSESDAIAINVLPDRCGDHEYFELWKRISGILQSDAKKIFQNFIYDVSYFSAYGVGTRNIYFDTMWANKVLYPELKANLGNVGRLFTRRAYWKDDGKVADEEGQKKDWGNVRDWHKHYLYNCRDTTGTFEAHTDQRNDLDSRGLLSFFDDYVMHLAEPILEMCTNGVPLDLEKRTSLKAETEKALEEATKSFITEVGHPLNPRSPKQLLTYLKEKGIQIPKKYDKKAGASKESTNAASIKKIRLKHPDMHELAHLQKIKTLEKSLSSYIDFDVRPDGRLSYSLNGCGTETLRMSGNKDPWDRGMNIQTIPGDDAEISIKSMFVAPIGHSFLNVDLRQAESRFVAYDAADKTLIDMLESGADVHTHVGNAILRQMGKDSSGITKEEFRLTWRQLGKKAGHGLNYDMQPNVFVETVFNELDLVISKKDAEIISAAYYGLFPGIPKWHAGIRNELFRARKLTTPSGWERYFYGRYGKDMFKEAYAFRPQHTIPWVTNKLMLHLVDERRRGNAEFNLLVQTHDSLLTLVEDANLENVAKICLHTKDWHPSIILSGGTLVIPTEVKIGKSMDKLKEWGT